jgi:hypothetical protein
MPLLSLTVLCAKSVIKHPKVKKRNREKIKKTELWNLIKDVKRVRCTKNFKRIVDAQNNDEMKRLIELGADINSNDGYFITQSRYYFNLEMVSFAFDCGAILADENDHLSRCVLDNTLEMLNIFLSRWTFTKAQYDRALNEAFENHEDDKFFVLVKYIDNNEIKPYIRGQIEEDDDDDNECEFLCKLCECGFDIHSDDEYLLRKAFLNNKFNFASILLEHGANPNHPNLDPKYPKFFLSREVTLDNIEMVELLLKHGANPKINNSDVLATSIIRRNIPMVRLLLKYGASLQDAICGGDPELEYILFNTTLYKITSGDVVN